MFVIDDALIGLAGSVLGAAGSWWSGKSVQRGQEQTNFANRDIAREQMQFQERMSNTAWQRAVKDMRDAGINPMLAVSQGGASTPAGAAIGMSNPKANRQEMYNSALKAAMDLRMQKESIDLMREQKKLASYQANSALADVDLKVENARLAHANAALTAANTRGVNLDNTGRAVEADIDSSFAGKILRALNRANPFAHSAASVSKAFKKPVSISKTYNTYKR